MTDLFRGYDLTTVADQVAEAHWGRQLAAAKIAEESKAQRTWDKLPANIKHSVKSGLLPIITDVLNALESDQVKPTEAKQMVEYGYDKGDRADPRWYENQHPLQHDTATATVWALHLNLHESVLKPVLERMSVLPETTGEYTYGDSFREWGATPPDDESDGHLVIYFHATPTQAASIGYHMANHATIAAMQAFGAQGANIPPYAVSTAGDYAEQLANLND